MYIRKPNNFMYVHKPNNFMYVHKPNNFTLLLNFRKRRPIVMFESEKLLFTLPFIFCASLD